MVYSMRLELTRVCSLNGFYLLMFFLFLMNIYICMYVCTYVLFSPVEPESGIIPSGQ